MITKRIIPCLDVKDSRVVKGTNFENLGDVDSPVELAKKYSDEGADELVFYDIVASFEGRKIFTNILSSAAKNVFIPLTVGGGVSNLDDFERVLNAGADKVSVNTGAIDNKNLIYEASRRYGSQCVVISCDIKRVGGKFVIFKKGGRENTGLDALEWIKKCTSDGAGEVVVNSIDTDGVKMGFDIPLLEKVLKITNVPVIASGGAGKIEDFITLFKSLPDIDAALAASVFHFGSVKISELKKEMKKNNIPVR